MFCRELKVLLCFLPRVNVFQSKCSLEGRAVLRNEKVGRFTRMQIQVYFCALHFRLSLTRNYSDNIVRLDVNMEETCKERQENELQAIQAIYMDDFQDLLEKVVLS